MRLVNGERFRETDAYKKGQWAEQVVERFLQSCGRYVLRHNCLRDYDGACAAMLFGATSNLILPDFMVADCEGQKPPFLAEVKYKAEAPECGKLGNRLVHGIQKLNWEDYLRVGLICRMEVWLFVVEEDTGDLLALRIDTTEPDDSYDGDKMGIGGMVYWLRSRFICVAHVGCQQGASAA